MQVLIPNMSRKVTLNVRFYDIINRINTII
jgi:hypothetical protein